jgi:hypothetical protein
LASDNKKLYIFTPFMKVIYAATSRPDKPYEKDGKPMFKVIMDPTPEDVKNLQDTIKKLIGNYEFKARVPKLGISKAEADGKITVRPVSLFKPVIFDMKNQPLQKPVWDEDAEEYTNWKDDLRLGSGSVVRCYCELNPYEKGVSLRLLAIQVKELVEWESKGGHGGSPFEAGEGYSKDNGSPFEDGANEYQKDEDNSYQSALDI